MAQYKTAKELGISSVERTALKAFAEAKVIGTRHVPLNGHFHLYDQGYIDASPRSFLEARGCGTAGCVAGYVYAHVKIVQNKVKELGARSAQQYIDKAAGGGFGCFGYSDVPRPLRPLYVEDDSSYSAQQAQGVVRKFLQTGRIEWPKDGEIEELKDGPRQQYSAGRAR